MELKMSIEKSPTHEWMVRMIYNGTTLKEADYQTLRDAATFFQATPIFDRNKYGGILWYNYRTGNYENEIPANCLTIITEGIDNSDLYEVENFLLDMVATVNTNPELVSKLTVKDSEREFAITNVGMTGRFYATHEFVRYIREYRV